MTEPITCKLEALPMPRDMEELKAQCDEMTHKLVEAEALKNENEVLKKFVKELVDELDTATDQLHRIVYDSECLIDEAEKILGQEAGK